jgi:hypothetical protein
VFCVCNYGVWGRGKNAHVTMLSAALDYAVPNQ